MADNGGEVTDNVQDAELDDKKAKKETAAQEEEFVAFFGRK